MRLEACGRLVLEWKDAADVPFVLSAIAVMSIMLSGLVHCLNTTGEDFNRPLCPVSKTAFAQLPDVVSSIGCPMEARSVQCASGDTIGDSPRFEYIFADIGDCQPHVTPFLARYRRIRWRGPLTRG